METVWLQRPNSDVPWGFRLHGGRDYSQPLTVQRVTPGSIAATGLKQGDVVLKIGDLETKYLTHQQAQNQIKTCANLLQLYISKGGSYQPQTAQSPYTTVTSGQDNYQYRGHNINDMYSQSPSGYDIGSATRYQTDPYPPYQQSPGGVMHSPSHGTADYRSGPESQFSQMSLSDPNSPYQSSPTYPYKPTSYNEPSSPYQAHTQQPTYAPPQQQHSNYPFSHQPPTQPYHSPPPVQPQYQSPSSYNPYLPQPDTQYGYNTGTQSAHAYSPPASTNYEPPYSYRPQAASQQSSSAAYPYTPQTQVSSNYPYTPQGGADSYSSPQSYNPPRGPPSYEDMYNYSSPRGDEVYARTQSPHSPVSFRPYNQTSHPQHAYTPSAVTNSPDTSICQSPQTRPDRTIYSNQISHNAFSPTPQSPQAAFSPTAQTSKEPLFKLTRLGSQSDSQSGNFSPTPYSPPTEFPPPPPTEGVPETPPSSSHSDKPPEFVAPPPPPPPPPPPVMGTTPTTSWRSKPTSSEHSNYDSGVSSTSSVSSLASNPSPPSPNHPQIPDQILNTMAKTDKKPFSYTPDLNEIKQQREKVKKRHDIMPKYQQMLNLPKFDDTPPRKPKPSGGPGSAVLSQYNSPIDMYSTNNVADAIMGQTAGLVSDVTPIGQSKSSQDITESATYKMIHGIEDKKTPQHAPAPQRMPSTEDKGMSDCEKGRGLTSPLKHGMSFRVLQWLTDTFDAENTDNICDEEAKGVRSPVREPSKDDELKFSGIHGPSSIPSRSFHVLQRMTSSEQEKQEEEETVGQYEEASIRYKGRNIPSKSFRMLQQMTGGEQQEEVTTSRSPRKISLREESSERQSGDEVEDRRYTGSDIPSRSFKVLQKYVGSDPVPAAPQAAPKKTTPISSTQHAGHDEGVTDF